MRSQYIFQKPMPCKDGGRSEICHWQQKSARHCLGRVANQEVWPMGQSHQQTQRRATWVPNSYTHDKVQLYLFRQLYSLRPRLRVVLARSTTIVKRFTCWPRSFHSFVVYTDKPCNTCALILKLTTVNMI